MSPDSEAGVFPKPLAGASSPRSMNFPSCICSTRERFRAGTPGATTMGSVAFELLLPPAREDMIAGRVPPENVMVAAEVVVARARVWLVGRENTGGELIAEQLLIPRLPMMLQEGMFPSPLLIPARRGGGGG